MRKKDKDIPRELKEANKEIKRLKKVINEKDLEVSFVVHDLKNPLSIIEMNFSLIKSVLESHEGLSKFKRISELIDSQVIAMKHLVHELLNISKMESSKQELQLTEVDVAPFLEKIREENSVVAENNGMRLQLSAENNLGSLSMDKNLVERVFANIILNAIKYSVESEELILHAMKSDKAEHIRFVVEDFGIGIPKENLSKIFEKFEHTKVGNSTKTVSHGLGLYFSKLVIELHGGTIWAESIEGKGSKFIFDLPRIRNDLSILPS